MFICNQQRAGERGREPAEQLSFAQIPKLPRRGKNEEAPLTADLRPDPGSAHRLDPLFRDRRRELGPEVREWTAVSCCERLVGQRQKLRTSP